MREDGVLCGEKRIARLLRQAQLRSVRSYKRPRYSLDASNYSTQPIATRINGRATRPSLGPDITSIRTHEGWLYLTMVINLYSRAVAGWSMNFTMASELVLDALMMAVWRRRPKTPVVIHSDQGSQSVFNQCCDDRLNTPNTQVACTRHFWLSIS